MNGIKVARRRIDGLEGQMPAVDAANLVLTQRLGAVMSLLPMAALRAEEDVEFVHQLRVASRRADAALRIFQPFVKGCVYRKTRTRLKKIRKAAGEAREHDVYATLLRSLLEPGDQFVNGQGDVLDHRRSAIEKLIAQSQQARQQAQASILAMADRFPPRKLDRWRHKLIGGLRSVCLDDVEEGETAMAFGSLARKRLKEFARPVRELAEELAQATPSISELHALRILGKRLRYAMEVFAPCFEDKLKQPYATVEAMQDALGEINDLDDLAMRFGKALRASAKGAVDGNGAHLSLEEHASVDALRQEVIRERDQRAAQFVDELEQGQWPGVIRIEAGLAEAPLKHASLEPEDDQAEVMQ